MLKAGLLTLLATIGLILGANLARADDLPCVSTTFRFIGKNDRVCVSAFDDPKVPGVACHVSQARTGGLSGTIGLAEDPSRFSIACRQIGPITIDVASLTDGEQVYSARTFIGWSTKSGTPSSTSPSATSSSRVHRRTASRPCPSCHGAPDAEYQSISRPVACRRSPPTARRKPAYRPAALRHGRHRPRGSGIHPEFPMISASAAHAPSSGRPR
jgi:catabolite regulation protein CreA